MSLLKILISGGGIAGPCLAWWLRKAGVDAHITIIERAPEPRVSGQAVDIRGAAVYVMKAMGLEQAIRDKNTTEVGLEFVYPDGISTAKIDATGDDKNQSFTSEYEILRADLARIFYDTTKELEGVEYVFDETIKDLVQYAQEDRVHVTFTNRLSAAYYDLVVGADGQISRTRRLVFGHGPNKNDYLRRMGEYMAFFTIPRIDTDTKYARWYSTTRGRLVCTRPSSYNDTRAFLAVVDWDLKRFDEIDDALKRRDEKRAKEWLVKEFRDAGWESERCLEGMKTAEDFYMQEIVQVKMGEEGFAKGRVALLGDAGYCPSPLSGMGTAVAIVGSYILAGEIASSPSDLPLALQRYTMTLRPFVDQCQKLMPGAPQIIIPQSAWALKLTSMLATVLTSPAWQRIGPWVKWAMPKGYQRDRYKLPKQYPGMTVGS
ncbi:FAD/NAD(P)-binding domain-containing protein [Bimuria novae-zelandiae CBS 107.79]|uniref:FAD/NAD(P)-binding domain-containing protein n=1 Tax=Bimuria novae-zelandiae CBS 107.79 TaxID=1447943 RepID=A0A6A5VZW2_9PLEO|nr:FAD/NAD(P)-binding domain-containing protein [Bimuria novae-zelandiae CBS 107.79]